MNAQADSSVLARLIRKTDAPDRRVEAKPTRIMRLSLARAAKHTVGLDLAVLSVTSEPFGLDDGVSDLADDMLMSLVTENGAVGCAALDLQMRTALVEVLTLGQVGPTPAEDRAITVADYALAQPFVGGFLDDLTRSSFETSLDGWADGILPGARFGTPKDIIMALSDVAYKRVEMLVELVKDGRVGRLVILLPDQAIDTAPMLPPTSDQFAQRISDAVMQAPAELTAVLHRYECPLSDIEALQVDQVIPLPGVTVGSVTLEGDDGHAVATARLGQSSGLRAVRIEATRGPDIEEAQMDQGMPQEVPQLAVSPTGADTGPSNAALES